MRTRYVFDRYAEIRENYANIQKMEMPPDRPCIRQRERYAKTTLTYKNQCHQTGHVFDKKEIRENYANIHKKICHHTGHVLDTKEIRENYFNTHKIYAHVYNRYAVATLTRSHTTCMAT